MIKVLLITIMFTIMASLLPGQGSAAELSAGASTWYVWTDSRSSSYETTRSSAFMYGPALSLKFNDDYNLTFVFLYGKFDEITNTDNATGESISYGMNRMDSDTALNYKLNSYFKIYAGPKYISYKFIIDEFGETVKHSSIGPGTGISAVLPLSSNFFLLGNLGGLYLWGKQERSSKMGDPYVRYNEYGINTCLSLAYYIEPASTSINIGWRYQYVNTKYEENTNNADPDDKNYFYGATLSATYSFSI